MPKSDRPHLPASLNRIDALAQAIGRAIEVRGGGVRGVVALAYRAWRMAWAIGPTALLTRLRFASTMPSEAGVAICDHAFPAPLPLADVSLRIGVMVHVFYPDLAEELAIALRRMPTSFVLMVSITDADAEDHVRAVFSTVPMARDLEIVRVPNRGRDIAPLVAAFRERILALDLVAHLHTKKSLHSGGSQANWRSYLVAALFGDADRIAWQLGMFAADPRLGMIYPESHASVPLWGHTWLGNVVPAQALATRLGITVAPHAYIDMPAGSMFWARVDAIRPLLELGLRVEDFPEERGQLDGTLQHAIERLFVAVVRASGHHVGILPRSGALALSLEGERNWTTYLQASVRERIQASAFDASLVSVDIFDTLVQRPFLTPAGARRYLDRLAQRTLGVIDFMALRERAEARARHAARRDPRLDEIYAALSALDPLAPVAALQALEIETERRLLTARTATVDAVDTLHRQGKRVIALSDMYLDTATLQQVLPEEVARLPDTWRVSCETGARKDDGSAWTTLAAEGASVANWLHIGDNEHSDVQQPHWQGLLTPVHVLRPGALLDVIPGLRPLRAPASASWGEQLRLGLIANHVSAHVDIDPKAYLGGVALAPRALGFVAIGPLILDYLTWLLRSARERGTSHLLFLSREGYLLAQAYTHLAAAWPGTAPQGHYFLASRQATGIAALRSIDDLQAVLGGTFNGTLSALVEARLGTAAAERLRTHVPASLWNGELFLPEMSSDAVDMLAPALDGLLSLAAEQRASYRRYTRGLLGNGDDGSLMVADLGYAGTIQRHLGRVLERPIDGAYFALDARASSVLAGVGDAIARYHDAREGEADSLILKHDLLLESLLTAPYAQFTGFSPGTDVMPQPLYATAAPPASQWSIVAEVHAGALAFVETALAAAGPLVDELAFDPEAVQIPLDCVGRGRWQAPWLASLTVDDAFTGRGAVPAG
ncbi:polysaccharide biosynthesis protein [Luteimonas sp. S4-F44]|uniref:rhamnan synthesis F family protein n=1 Tax=Luteimonas sp. S4-F44 TaxID=2925842 RepID=UPI001F5331CA|nr:rhamnan synthesis F family protein [Luteimonas sp. S4-F44]UNK41894.1 polysaccharide biosynthesis protein [Luteimonas sp. S4-F44]